MLRTAEIAVRTAESFDYRIDQDLAFVGAPDTVTRAIAAQQQHCGYDVLAAYHRILRMPHELAHRQRHKSAVQRRPCAGTQSPCSSGRREGTDDQCTDSDHYAGEYRALQQQVSEKAGNALAYAHIGHVLVATGRAREGLDHIRYALRLSPADPHRTHWVRFAGEAELELGRHEQAIVSLRQSYALNPRQPQTLRALAAAEAASGRMDEARKHLAELKEVAPHISQERLLKQPLALASDQPELLRGLQLALSPPE